MLEVLNRLSSKSVILMGDFNYGGIDWDNNLASNKKEEEFLDIVNDAFLTQHDKVPTREENILDLVFSSEPGMVDEVVVSSPISNSDHNVIKFKILFSSEIKQVYNQQYDYNKCNY